MPIPTDLTPILHPTPSSDGKIILDHVRYFFTLKEVYTFVCEVIKNRFDPVKQFLFLHLLSVTFASTKPEKYSYFSDHVVYDIFYTICFRRFLMEEAKAIGLDIEAICWGLCGCQVRGCKFSAKLGRRCKR